MSDPLGRDLIAHIAAYIVYQSNTLDVQMLSVEGVLEEFYNVVSNGILRSET